MRSTFYCWIVYLLALFLPERAPAQRWADSLEVTMSPAMREYCHIIRFPQGWAVQKYDKNGQFLAFPGTRISSSAPGVLSTEFLVKAFELLGEHCYSSNVYKVDLSDFRAVPFPSSRKPWEDTATVPLTRKSIFPPAPMDPLKQPAEFHGFQFEKRGEIWAQPYDPATRLSPDGAWRGVS